MNRWVAVGQGAMLLVAIGWAFEGAPNTARAQEESDREREVGRFEEDGSVAQEEETDGSRDAGLPTVAARERARTSFVQGVRAAEEGRWGDALPSFREAYLFSRVPSALYNMAMALRALGRHREARDAFEQLLANHPDSGSAETAAERRDEEAARVVVLTLVGLDPEGTYQVRVDAREVDVGTAAEVVVETDPGVRVVEARRDGYTRWVWRGRLRDGERRRLAVRMSPESPQDGEGAEEAEDGSERKGIWRNPIFWTVIGVVVVGTAVGVGVWALREQPLGGDHAMQMDI